MTYDPNSSYPYPPQPTPPKKNKVGKILSIGCGGILALALFGGCMAAITSGSDDDGSNSAPAQTSAAPHTKGTVKEAKPKPTKKDKPKSKVVTFKVWGTAPAGALGPLDITYGSDSDNLKGHFKNGTFTATLPLDDDAMYYDVSAQLQGSGDIRCSVTVDGKSDKGHAAGDYNICSAQLSVGLLGGWD